MRLFKQLYFLAVVVLGTVVLGAGSVLAIDADPTARVEVTQPDGVTKLTIRPVGDERTGRLVTMDGYTVVKGDDGWFRYATLDAGGGLVASDMRAGALDARSTAEEEFLTTIEPYLQASDDRLVPTLQPMSEEQMRMLTQRSAQTTNDLLIILIQFPDVPFVYPSSDFDDLINLPGFDYFGCMNEYFNEISYGEFGVNGTATIWYTAAYNHGYYGYGTGDNWDAAAELVHEAVIAADPDVDFSLYDYNDDGEVEGIFVVHSGPGAESGFNDYPWSHAWSLEYADVGVIDADGVTINRYSMEPEKINFMARIRIGVFCHEYGHMLGLPDLYDTDYSSIGVGDWCLMGGGSWNGPYGYGQMSPAHMSVWCKSQMGWLAPIVVAGELTGVTIPNVEENSVGYRLWNQGAGGPEHFLVEYRDQVGFDTYLPGCGLAVWHIDENMPGNSQDNHRLVDLEEMDGSENNSAGDMFLNDSFNHHTSPNSDSYYGDSTYVALTVHSTSCILGGLVVDMATGEDLCALDDDSDGYGNCDDNCPDTYNPGQADWNDNGTGDACEDSDSDGLNDDTDNCILIPNPLQEDQDSNGIGDACCCGVYAGGYTGNTNCSVDGLVTLSDITLMIDRVYISKAPLCCPDAGNTNASLDGKCTLSDIARAIDKVYVSKDQTEACP
jgi:M6 family metalloprotease-like protein